LEGVHSSPSHFALDRQRKHVIFSVPGDGTVQIVDAFGTRVHQIDGMCALSSPLFRRVQVPLALE
jgi:hypothetical protein